MNRTEFCEMMAQAKKESGVTTSELSFTLRMLVGTLRRLEKGVHNFSVEKTVEYLNVLNAELCLEKEGEESHSIKNYDSFIEWLANARAGQYTQRSLATELGCSYVAIANIERKKSIISIDTFLKLMDVLGYTIKITSRL